MGPSTLRRACDQCKRRKIKCNSANPCAACSVASLTCSYDEPARKRGRKKATLSMPVSTSPASTIELPRTPRHVRAESPRNDPVPLSEGPSQTSLPAGVRRRRITEDASIFPSVEHQLWSILDNLVSDLGGFLPSAAICQTVNACVDLFFHLIYPNLPICHEPTIRRSAWYFFVGPGRAAAGGNDGGRSLAGSQSEMSWQHPRRDGVRSFTLLASLCAMTTIFHSSSFTQMGGLALGPSFLAAARQMLREYEDYDLQNPDSSSLAIRLMLSAAIQQHTGQNNLAWHILGQAGLLARTLRLYSEEALAKYDPLEATLLRNVFWAIYTADQTGLVVGNRAVSLAEPLFDAKLDARPRGADHVPLLDTSRPQHQGAYDHVLLEGYHILRRVWELAARIIITMRSHHHNQAPEPMSSRESERVTAQYVQFCSLLDELPSSFQRPETVSHDDATIAAYRTLCFKQRKSSMLVMFHCANVLIVHQAYKCGMPSVLGLHQDQSIQAMVETNAASEFIRALQEVPSETLQAYGEPSVELIRTIGAVLLEASSQCPRSAVQERAKAQLRSLLDILAKLDSPALDEFSRHEENSCGY